MSCRVLDHPLHLSIVGALPEELLRRLESFVTHHGVFEIDLEQ